MSFLTAIGRAFLDGLPADETVTRSAAYEYPSFEQQFDAIRNRARGTYRAASVDEAMGVPSIFGAVSLIANTVGTLSLEAFRKGIRMPQEDAPRLIQRPNPFTTLRVFLRDTAYYLATRGEAWWWIAARDPVDGSPLSLYPIPPWELVVTQDDGNRLRPEIRWADRLIPNDDIRQITYLPGREGRGVGPLQKAGAAVSVAVEAQEWAANFFSGSIPSMIGTTDQMMTEDELKMLDRQWVEKPNNLPRWMVGGMTMDESPFDPEKAQLTDARRDNVGDHARMFNMPGALLEYQMGGSSLTYQNQQDIWDDFARRCLSPHYLEPIEQEMSDLLTRSTVSRFNMKQLLRSSPKERMEVHTAAIAAGIYGPEVAAQEEGYAPGSVDFAPVPLAPPQAIPTLLPPNREIRTAYEEVRCPKCSRLVGEAVGPARIVCKRCGVLVEKAS